MTLPLTLRAPATPREWNFVRDSWTRSAVKARPARRFASQDGGRAVYEQMPVDLFVAGHSRYVDRVLARGARVVVAETPSALGMVSGWLCYGSGVVHYCYVLKDLRRFGVATALIGELASQPMAYPMWTPVLARLRVPEAWEWDETRRWV